MEATGKGGHMASEGAQPIMIACWLCSYWGAVGRVRVCKDDVMISVL